MGHSGLNKSFVKLYDLNSSYLRNSQILRAMDLTRLSQILTNIFLPEMQQYEPISFLQREKDEHEGS